MGLGFKIPNPIKEVKKALDPISDAVKSELNKGLRLEKLLRQKGLEIITSSNGQRVTRKLKPGETLDFTYKYQGGLGSWIRRTKFRM